MLSLWLSGLLAVGACSPDALQGRLPDLARAGGGTMGLAALIVESGDTLALLHADDHFPMQSVYKLPIAMAVLQQVDQGKLSLDQQVRVTPRDFISRGQHSPLRDEHPHGVTLSLRDLLRLTVSESDGTASDVVMRLAGGATAIDAYLRALGIDAIKVIDTEQAMGRDETAQYRNWATPRGAVALLRILQAGEPRAAETHAAETHAAGPRAAETLSPASRALLQDLLTHGSRGANRIAGLLPAGTIVAHKPGSSGTDRHGVAAATNDIALVTLPDGQHLALAVFITDSKSDDAARDAAIARAAQAVWTCQTSASPTR